MKSKKIVGKIKITKEMKYQNLLKSLARFLASQPMKIFIQLLVSVSLFSFVFSYSSSYLSFFTHSLKFSYSAFPFQLLGHATDKNYVFLICNGIFLVLLAKTSSEEKEEKEEEEEKNRFLNELQEAEPLCIGAQASYLKTSNEHVLHEDKEVSLNVENTNSAVVEYNKKEATSKEEGGFGGEECCTTYNIVEADNNSYEENEMESHEIGFLVDDVEVVEEENDEPLSKLSTEELNKKFEEFIRRMKEEIRIEARQQLILVK